MACFVKKLGKQPNHIIVAAAVKQSIPNIDNTLHRNNTSKDLADNIIHCASLRLSTIKKKTPNIMPEFY